MRKTRPVIVTMNLALAALICFSVAFFPYFLSSSGAGIDRATDVFSAIKDAFRISRGVALSSFCIPLAIGILTLATIALIYIPRFDDRLLGALRILTLVSVTLVIVSSFLIQGVHISIIALIPIGFALLSGRRWSVE